jgi:hypothetical protein
LGPKGMRTGNGEGLTMRNFIVCTVHLIFRAIKSERLRMEEGRGGFKIVTDKSG